MVNHAAHGAKIDQGCKLRAIDPTLFIIPKRMYIGPPTTKFQKKDHPTEIATTSSESSLASSFSHSCKGMLIGTCARFSSESPVLDYFKKRNNIGMRLRDR